jgi:hypothetical protein
MEAELYVLGSGLFGLDQHVFDGQVVLLDP